MCGSRCRSLAFTCAMTSFVVVAVSACGGGANVDLDNSIIASSSVDTPLDYAKADPPTFSNVRHSRVAEAAQNQPAPGSVTQSSRANEYGVTVDIVDAEVSDTGELANFVVSFNDLVMASTVEGEEATDVANAHDQPKGTQLYERSEDSVEFYRSIEGSPAEFGKHGPLSESWGLPAGDIWVDMYSEPVDEAPREEQVLVIGDRVRGLTARGMDNKGHLNGVSGTFVCTLPCTFQVDDAGPSDPEGERAVSSSSGYTFVPDKRYLAHGIWVFAPDDATSFVHYEYGTFSDGNDPFELENLAGLTGTATYVGENGVKGIYASAGEQSNQFFDADVTLTASFAYGGKKYGIDSGSHK